MKQKIASLSAFTLSLVVIVLILYFAQAIRPQGSAQGSIDQVLKERLIKLGVPVQSVVVTKQAPLEVKVVVQSPVESEHLDQIDSLYLALADHELRLAYLYLGNRINSFQLVILSPKSYPKYDGTEFLYPDEFSQKVTEFPPSSIDDNKTKDIVIQDLQLNGLILQSSDVPSNFTSVYNDRMITLNLSTGVSAEKTDVSKINEFVIGLEGQLGKLNSQYGTRIVFINLYIRDSQGKLVTEYIYDLQVKSETTFSPKGIKVGWGPGVAPTLTPNPLVTTSPTLMPTVISPVIITTAIPTSGSSVYPPPSLLPTSRSYP